MVLNKKFLFFLFFIFILYFFIFYFLLLLFFFKKKKKDECAFEISGVKKSFIVKATSEKEKKEWMSEINKQLEEENKRRFHLPPPLLLYPLSHPPRYI